MGDRTQPREHLLELEAMTSDVDARSALVVAHRDVSSSSPQGHLDFLDGLRALAALMVVVHHAQLEVWADGTGRELYAGRLSVNVFIVLSGFCLMLPVARAGGALRGGALRFFARRAQRILPPYYLTVGLSLLLVWLFIGQETGSHFDVSLPVTTRGVIAHALLLQDVLHRGEINHPLWSIAVEWKIYFLFPLLLLCWSRLGTLATTALAVVGGVAAFTLLRGRYLQGLTPHFVGLFTLGMLAVSVVHDEARARLPWRLIALLFASGAAALVIAGWGVELSSLRCALLDTVVGVATASALVAAAVPGPRGPLHAVVASRPLVRIGSFSYSLYLVHAPLQHLFWQYAVRPLGLGRTATFALLVGVGTPLLVAASWLFFAVCERPFIPGKARDPSTRPAVATGA